MLGFTYGDATAEGDDSGPTTDEDMATMALESGAIRPNRVLAYYAARHLLADERPRPSPEETATFAAWLSGGPRDDDEEQEETEGFRPSMLIDWFPPVWLLRRLRR